MKNVAFLTLGLVLVLGAGFVFVRPSARSSPEALSNLPEIEVKSTLEYSLNQALLHDPASRLLAVVLNFEGDSSGNELVNHYHLFSQAEKGFFTINPLHNFSIEDIDPSSLGLDLTLEPIDADLIQIWPSAALAIANNNGGANFSQEGDFKIDLLLTKPEEEVLAWYITYRHLEKGLFKIAVNALSGTVLK